MRPATHGHTCGGKFSPTYHSWMAMVQRCTNPARPSYPRYGGRGIGFPERWAVFENFLADVGERPAGRTLDRIRNDEDYGPANCRWATPAEQAQNRSSNVIYVEGDRQGLTSWWANELGISSSVAQHRMRCWHTFERGRSWQRLSTV